MKHIIIILMFLFSFNLYANSKCIEQFVKEINPIYQKDCLDFCKENKLDSDQCYWMAMKMYNSIGHCIIHNYDRDEKLSSKIHEFEDIVLQEKYALLYLVALTCD